MKVILWGTRGSLPASLPAASVRKKVFESLKLANGATFRSDREIEDFIDQRLPFHVRGSYGSNTTCYQVDNPGGPYLLCDCGTGLRDFGHYLVKSRKISEPAEYHIFMTHLHWDHLQGFPFFVPAFKKENRIIIHSYHKEAESAFRQQMQPPFFPIPLDVMAARIEFDIQPPLSPFQISGFEITACEQKHPGVSYGYRFSKGGKSVVVSTDSEHKKDAYEADYPFLEFINKADLLIFDAQYSMADAVLSKADWGHSSNVMAVELSTRASVKRLVLCHHDPLSSDSELDDFLQTTKLYREIYHEETGRSHQNSPLEILLAYDGLTLEL